MLRDQAQATYDEIKDKYFDSVLSDPDALDEYEDKRLLVMGQKYRRLLANSDGREHEFLETELWRETHVAIEWKRWKAINQGRRWKEAIQWYVLLITIIFIFSQTNQHNFLHDRITWIIELHEYREQKKDNLESEALYRRDIVVYEDTLRAIQEWYDENDY